MTRPEVVPYTGELRDAQSACGDPAPIGTVRAVPPHEQRDIRSLRPRDYLRESFRFGKDPAAVVQLPAGGDPRSLQVAWVQHQVACQLRGRTRPRTGIGAGLARRFAFSRQLWSLCLAGERWMGEAVLAAAVTSILDLPDPTEPS